MEGIDLNQQLNERALARARAAAAEISRRGPLFAHLTAERSTGRRIEIPRSAEGGIELVEITPDGVERRGGLNG
jgi:hypothetical protein